MRAHPDIAMLRSYPKAQHRPVPPSSDWRALPQAGPLVAALDAYGQGAELRGVPPLAAVLSDLRAAQALVEAVVVHALAALERAPLDLLPFAHSLQPGLARVRIAEAGRATLTLIVYERRNPGPRPVSVLFEDGEAHDMVVAGQGAALLHQLGAAGIVTREIALTPGSRMAIEGAGQSRQIHAAETSLLVLRLSRMPANPEPSREFSLPDGQLIRASSGCKRTSQSMVALAVLGALSHRPAAAPMERLALNPDKPRHLRWEALRQLLAMDARAGTVLLERLANERGGVLAGPAAALWRNLVAAHPELAGQTAAGVPA